MHKTIINKNKQNEEFVKNLISKTREDLSIQNKIPDVCREREIFVNCCDS